MESEKPSALQQAEGLRVSEDLIKQLHDANARLHDATRLMGQTMDDTEEDHQHRLDVIGNELKAAERAVEEISTKIHNALKPAPGGDTEA